VCPLAGMASSFLLSDFLCLSKLAPKRLDYRESFFIETSTLEFNRFALQETGPRNCSNLVTIVSTQFTAMSRIPFLALAPSGVMALVSPGAPEIV
jgi:hypothetical protein